MTTKQIEHCSRLGFRHLLTGLSVGLKSLTRRRQAREVSQSLADWASSAGRLRLSSSGSAQKLLSTSVTFAAEPFKPRADSRFLTHDHSRALSPAGRSRRNWPARPDPTGFASLRALSAFALNSEFSRSHERDRWRNASLGDELKLEPAPAHLSPFFMNLSSLPGVTLLEGAELLLKVHKHLSRFNHADCHHWQLLLCWILLQTHLLSTWGKMHTERSTRPSGRAQRGA